MTKVTSRQRGEWDIIFVRQVHTGQENLCACNHQLASRRINLSREFQKSKVTNWQGGQERGISREPPEPSVCNPAVTYLGGYLFSSSHLERSVSHGPDQTSRKPVN